MGHQDEQSSYGADAPARPWPLGAPKLVRLARSEAAADPQASIVVGFDRQPQSLTALGTAADLAARLSARLQVVHAIDLADYPIDPDSDDWEEDARNYLAEERAQVASVLSSISTGWEYHAVRGDPVRALLEAAEKYSALMIVVGSHGEGWRHSLERLFSPSVSHGVISRGTRPVLVVCDRHGGAGTKT